MGGITPWRGEEAHRLHGRSPTLFNRLCYWSGEKERYWSIDQQICWLTKPWFPFSLQQVVLRITHWWRGGRNYGHQCSLSLLKGRSTRDRASPHSVWFGNHLASVLVHKLLFLLGCSIAIIFNHRLTKNLVWIRGIFLRQYLFNVEAVI